LGALFGVRCTSRKNSLLACQAAPLRRDHTRRKRKAGVSCIGDTIQPIVADAFEATDRAFSSAALDQLTRGNRFQAEIERKAASEECALARI
jgi:hypothetical protein